jgi:Na+-translocating ferredoxin:NAD+ oxidoreductase RnfC subunit
LYDRSEILQRIRQAGVIGAGGAGFPTYKKLDARVSHVIANGAECEPLLYKDRETMLHHRDRLIDGLILMRTITGAQKVTLAVKKKNEDVLRFYRDAARENNIDFFVYKDVYPAGDEYVLVYEITGKQIPPGGLPLQVGCVVDNVETIVNLARAGEGQAVTEKVVTVTGAVKNAVTLTVPVGSSIADCIREAGGATTENPVVLTGGVMMGGHTRDLNQPVSRTLGGIIVLPEDHYLVRRKGASRESYTRIGHGQCDQCSLCTELCPRYILGYPIEPHKVMRNLLMTGEAKDRASLWAQYCCECNVCSLIACPEQLDPKNICVDAKVQLKSQGLSRSEAELESLFREPHPAREGREIPISTLYQKLGLRPYDRHAEWRPGVLAVKRVVLPLDSHIGAPAVPTVNVEQAVQRGEIIADVAPEQLGVPVHASIDGIVTAVSDKSITIEQNRQE